MDHVARVAHSERDGFFVRPVARGVRTEPCGRGAVAIFAGDAFGQFEWTAALLRRGVERMTCEALRRFFGFRIEFQNAGDAFADVSGQRLICTTVLVFYDPGRILILENAAASNGFDAAVAACGGAGAGADIFHWLAVRIGRLGGRRCSVSSDLASGIASLFRRTFERRAQREERSAQRGAQPIGFGDDLHSQ